MNHRVARTVKIICGEMPQELSVRKFDQIKLKIRKFEQLEQMEKESRRAAEVCFDQRWIAELLKILTLLLQEYQEAKETQRAKVTALLVKKGFFPS